MENSQPPRTRRTAHDRAHSVSRERVLRELERSGPTSVAVLATATGLHENTVRGHLERLLTDGYVRHATASSSGRKGRPTRHWSATPPTELTPNAGLAIALADALGRTHPDAPALARAAGERWGKELAAQFPEERDGRELAIRIMREQGFAPETREQSEAVASASPSPSPSPERSDAPIELHRCPLLAAASERTEVVCAVHEGMIEGIVQAGAPGTNATLHPFATPGTCILQLREAP